MLHIVTLLLTITLVKHCYSFFHMITLVKLLFSLHMITLVKHGYSYYTWSLIMLQTLHMLPLTHGYTWLLLLHVIIPITNGDIRLLLNMVTSSNTLWFPNTWLLFVTLVTHGYSGYTLSLFNTWFPVLCWQQVSENVLLFFY